MRFGNSLQATRAMRREIMEKLYTHRHCLQIYGRQVLEKKSEAKLPVLGIEPISAF